MLTCLVPVLFKFYIQDVLKLKNNNNSGAKECILNHDARNHELKNFIIVFIRYSWWFLSWQTWIQSTCCDLIFKDTFKSYPFIYSKFFQVGTFLLSSPTKSSMEFSSLPRVKHTCHQHVFLRSYIIRRVVQISISSSSLCNFLHPLSNSKHIPQYPVIENRCFLFVLQCDRPCFAHIQLDSSNIYAPNNI